MKRVWVFLLAALVLSHTYSCGEAAPDTTGGEVSAETDETTAAPLQPAIPAVDGGGRVFTILDQNRTSGTFNLYFEEFGVTEITGDVVNDAVYELNRNISEKYNLVIQTVKSDSAATTLNNSVLAGDTEFAVGNLSITDAINLSTKQVLTDLNTLPVVDVSNPWWFGSVAADSSVHGRLYYAISDANINAFNAIGVTCFNKDMAAEYSVDDPYALVKSGEWTIDALLRLSRTVSADLDGNAVMDEKDMYGLATNNFVWMPLFYGTDSTFITKDSADTPVFSYDAERVNKVLTRIVDLVADRNAVFYGETFNGVIPNGRAELPRKLFIEDRALFWIELMYSIPTLRETEVDFGILPMPKLDDAQAQYSTFMHNVASVLVVPVTNGEPALTGSVLEDMAYQASLIVRPAYIEKLIKGKISRDVETVEIFDTLYEKIHNDFIIHLSGVTINTGIRRFLDSTDYGFASFFATNQPAIETKLAEMVDAIDAIDAIDSAG